MFVTTVRRESLGNSRKWGWWEPGRWVAHGEEGPQWSLDEKGWAFSLKWKEGSNVRSSWKRSRLACQGGRQGVLMDIRQCSVQARQALCSESHMTQQDKSQHLWTVSLGLDCFPTGITSNREQALPLCLCYILIVIDWGSHGPLLNGGGGREKRRVEGRYFKQWSFYHLSQEH